MRSTSWGTFGKSVMFILVSKLLTKVCHSFFPSWKSLLFLAIGSNLLKTTAPTVPLFSNFHMKLEADASIGILVFCNLVKLVAIKE